MSARPLPELLDAIGSRTPAPGAGSTSAWAGALAAALLEMVAAYAEDPAIASRAAELRAELLGCAERELSSYAPVLAAQRAGTDVSEALSAASETPLAIARAAAEVADLAAAVHARSRPALRGDAAAGVLLAEAVCQVAGRLVQINLADRQADPRLAEVASLLQRATDARRRALA